MTIKKTETATDITYTIPSTGYSADGSSYTLTVDKTKPFAYTVEYSFSQDVTAATYTDFVNSIEIDNTIV